MATLRWVLHPPLRRADIPEHCRRLAQMLSRQVPARVRCDVGAVIAPDLATLETLARLRLVAQRHGCGFGVCEAAPQLRMLAELTGLSDHIGLSREE